MSEFNMKEIEIYLSRPKPDSEDPRLKIKHKDWFEYFSKMEIVNTNYTMSLNIVKTYPNLLYNISDKLKANAKFILSIVELDFFNYFKASKEIMDYCEYNISNGYMLSYSYHLAELKEKLLELSQIQTEKEQLEMQVKIKEQTSQKKLNKI